MTEMSSMESGSESYRYHSSVHSSDLPTGTSGSDSYLDVSEDQSLPDEDIKRDLFFNKFISNVISLDNGLFCLFKPQTMEIVTYLDYILKIEYEDNDVFWSAYSEYKTASKFFKGVHNKKGMCFEEHNMRNLKLINFNELDLNVSYFDFSMHDYIFAPTFLSSSSKDSVSDNLATSKLGLFHTKNIFVSFHQSSIHSTYHNSIQVITSEANSPTYLFDKITNLTGLEESILFLSRYSDDSWIHGSLPSSNYLGYSFYVNNEKNMLTSLFRIESLGYKSARNVLRKQTFLLRTVPSLYLNFDSTFRKADVKQVFDFNNGLTLEYIQKSVVSPNDTYLAILTNFGRVKLFLTSELQEQTPTNLPFLQFSHLDDVDFFNKYDINISTFKKRFKNEVEVHMSNADWCILNNGSIKDIDWLDDKRLIYVTELYTERADDSFSANSVPADGKINFGFQKTTQKTKNEDLVKKLVFFKEPVLKVLYLSDLDHGYNHRNFTNEANEGTLYPYSLTLDTFKLFEYPQQILGIRVDVVHRRLVVLVLCEQDSDGMMNSVVLNFEYSNSNEFNVPIQLEPLNIVTLKSKKQITDFELISKNYCVIRYNNLFEWINLKTGGLIRKAVLSNTKQIDTTLTDGAIILPIRSDRNLAFETNHVFKDSLYQLDNDSKNSMDKALSLTPEPKNDYSDDRMMQMLKVTLNSPDTKNYFNILHFSENKAIIYDTLLHVYILEFDREKVISQIKLQVIIKELNSGENSKINILKLSKKADELIMIFNDHNVAKCQLTKGDISIPMVFECVSVKSSRLGFKF
ncbi:hypothetical protein QEN19_003442 [Hanseniaspora menglaensis]